MKKKIEQSVPQDGWTWVRLFVPLRGGHYHHEWIVARVKDGRAWLPGSKTLIPLTAPVLEKALWVGPIEPPSLDVQSATALALGKVERNVERSWTSTEDKDEPGAMARAVADGIVDAFVRTVNSLGAYYREHAEERIALVEKIAELIHRVRR